jgi:hypothetical protein
VVTPDSGGVLAVHEAAATRARMGLAQGHGRLRWVGGNWTGSAGLKAELGCSRLRLERLGRRIKGAATDFVCWADSSHGPKMWKRKGKRNRFLFIFRNYFRGRNNLENS